MTLAAACVAVASPALGSPAGPAGPGQPRTGGRGQARRSRRRNSRQGAGDAAGEPGSRGRGGRAQPRQPAGRALNVKGSAKVGNALGLGAGIDTDGGASYTLGGSDRGDFDGSGVRNSDNSFGFKTEGKVAMRHCRQF